MMPSFTVDPHTLDNYNLQNFFSLQQWQHQLSKAIDQLQGVLTNPNALAGILSGSGSASPLPPQTSLTDLGSPAGNSTVNVSGAFLVAINLKWTTAANWTLLISNLGLGSIVYLRLLNNSGAARTFTLTAKNPASVSYGVSVWVPGAGPLTGAISVGNGNALNLNGVSYTVSGAPALQLFGFGSTG